MSKKPIDEAKVAEATKIVDLIVRHTRCPDPGEGGCIGGPIPGYGCVHEAARAALQELWRAHGV